MVILGKGVTVFGAYLEVVQGFFRVFDPRLFEGIDAAEEKMCLGVVRVVGTGLRDEDLQVMRGESIVSGKPVASQIEVKSQEL